MRAASLCAALALVPAMCGPAIARDPGALRLSLCGGGALTIPPHDRPALPPTEPCCAKGCHSPRKRGPPKAAD